MPYPYIKMIKSKGCPGLLKIKCNCDNTVFTLHNKGEGGIRAVCTNCKQVWSLYIEEDG